MSVFRELCLWLGVLGLASSGAAAPGSVKLIAPAGYLPQIPFLVRMELWNGEGERAREIWDAEAVLSVDQPGITISTNQVRLYNGLGTVLVTFGGDGDFSLRAGVGELSAMCLVRSLSGLAVTTVSGSLTDSNTVWQGIVHVTDDVIVPAGHTLTLASNTWVLMDGVASGPPAADLLIFGRLQSLGTETHPVTITCANPGLHWGQIRHERAEPSLYQHTIVTRAGQAPREPHTGTGPAIRVTNSVITFVHCTLSDHAGASGRPGKVLQASGSELVFDDCVMARSRMGPEVDGTILLCTNSYLMEMLAGVDDEDALYVHYQGPGRTAKISRCVVAATTDDGLDMVGSGVTVEDCIIRDIVDKGISLAQGEQRGSDLIKNCLIVSCGIGVSTKGVLTNTTRIDRSTILGRDIGVGVPATVTEGHIHYYITNSIVGAMSNPAQSVSIFPPQDPANIQIFYSNVLQTNWPGPGNISADPRFVDNTTNFQLRADSPCIDQGDPASPPDPDGSRADMGAFPFQHPSAPVLLLANPRFSPVGSFGFTVVGQAERIYLIQASSDLNSWTTLGPHTNTADRTDWFAPLASDTHRFYRGQEVSR